MKKANRNRKPGGFYKEPSYDRDSPLSFDSEATSKNPTPSEKTTPKGSYSSVLINSMPSQRSISPGIKRRMGEDKEKITPPDSSEFVVLLNNTVTESEKIAEYFSNPITNPPEIEQLNEDRLKMASLANMLQNLALASKNHVELTNTYIAKLVCQQALAGIDQPEKKAKTTPSPNFQENATRQSRDTQQKKGSNANIFILFLFLLFFTNQQTLLLVYCVRYLFIINLFSLA